MYPSPASATRSEDETQEQPRKRTARACDSCYKRKIKCDAAVPSCNWCSHHNIPCTFTRTIQRRRKEKNNGIGPDRLLNIERDRQQKTSRLAERISRIEQLLTENLIKGCEPPVETRNSPVLSMMSDIPSPREPPAASSVAMHFAGREFGVVSMITGIPFFLPEGQQWIQSRTGQLPALDKITASRPPWEKQRNMGSNALLMAMQSHNPFELPDRNLVLQYFDVYNSSIMRLVFPVLDSALFSETIEAAYQQPQRNFYFGQASSRACIFAFLAFASVVHPCGDHCESGHGASLPPPVDSESFVTKAQCLIPQVMQETTTLDGLQTMVMLSLFELVSGNMRSAHYFGSLAGRFIFMLGAHTTSHISNTFPIMASADVNSKTQLHLRNIFWLCYTIDKDLALRTGQPLILSDENCDLTMPPGYVEKLYTSMAFPHQSREMPESPLFPVDLRLSIIKARAYSALYSLRGLQKTDAELLKEIRELDDELERWRSSVPIEWRPTMSFSSEMPPDPNMSMHSVMLRLNYHLCMTVIHLASSRCKAWSGQGGMTEGVSSSLALSVEASRSTLLYLQAAEHVLVDGIFWTLIFYPMSALLAIFCNILHNPLDPQSMKDMDLLRIATGMMERMFLRQLSSVNEIVHIKLIADFVNELNRLAKCAIDKAWSERS